VTDLLKPPLTVSVSARHVTKVMPPADEPSLDGLLKKSLIGKKTPLFYFKYILYNRKDNIKGNCMFFEEQGVLRADS